MPPSDQVTDERYMMAAIRLGQRHLGNTWPNPAVGAVIVAQDGRIVGRGSTQPGGRPHAETQAIKEAGDAAKDATIYVTLEPCSHQGQTPPCTKAIIDSGIKRVVTALVDPDKRVAGKGLIQLKQAGLSVELGICWEEALWANIGYFQSKLIERPFIQLKMAHNKDGFVAYGERKPVQITGALANSYVHDLRARADAIMVGVGTVIADNPLLTCRKNGMQDLSPLRIIIDPELKLPQDARVLDQANGPKTWVITSKYAEESKKKDLIGHQIRVIVADSTSNKMLNLNSVFENLAKEGITRVMVEGGPQIARTLLIDQMIDEAILIEGRANIPEDGLKMFDTHGPSALTQAEGYKLMDERRLMIDVARIYRRQDWQDVYRDS